MSHVLAGSIDNPVRAMMLFAGSPHPRLEVVQALEARGRGLQDSYHAGRKPAQVIEHADEEAACLVRAVLVLELFLGVAERFEEHHTFEVPT